ncbi:MAG: hypothetical protein ACRDNY_01405 [Gaiellaceae bacterium]
MLENIFVYERVPGHEIAFVFEVELEDRLLYERDEFEYVDLFGGEEVRVRALWVDPSRLDAPLSPTGCSTCWLRRSRALWTHRRSLDTVPVPGTVTGL